MAAAPGLTLDEPRALEHTLRPRVADREAVLSGELLVEVADVEVEVALAIEAEHLFECGRGDAAGARPAAAAVEEGVEAETLVLLFPAPHVARAHAQNLGSLNPSNLLSRRTKDDFLYFHGPLHGGLRVIRQGLVLLPISLYSLPPESGHLMCY